jgi:hypothetical protein
VVKNGREISYCPPRLIRSLVEDLRSHESIERLDTWHRERISLTCRCGATWHVVQRGFPHLHRNPGQVYFTNKECLLCERKPRREARSGRKAQDDRPVVGLILCTPNHPTDRLQACNLGADAADSDRPNPNAMATFLRVLEQAGFTSPERPIGLDACYYKTRAVFAEIEIPAFESGTPKTIADFAWMPGGIYTGGLGDLNRRLLRNWPEGKYKAEGWIFAVLDSVSSTPDGCFLRIPHLHPATEVMYRMRGDQVRGPYKYYIPPHKAAQVRCSGPHLVLLVCSPDEVDAPYRTKPIARRLLVQPIAHQTYPVPVESQYERDVALLLRRRSLRFLKPVFPDSEGFRPDFILGTNRIIIEVQGMKLQGYHESKEEIQRRMMASPRYASYRLLTYRPCDGQTLASFERELMQAVNGAKPSGLRIVAGFRVLHGFYHSGRPHCRLGSPGRGLRRLI